MWVRRVKLPAQFGRPSGGSVTILRPGTLGAADEPQIQRRAALTGLLTGLIQKSRFHQKGVCAPTIAAQRVGTLLSFIDVPGNGILYHRFRHGAYERG
jgi:hypothetical protein